MNVDDQVSLSQLGKPLERMFALASEKVRRIEATWDTSRGTPVFTVQGRYTTRGWTEWTQGFQYGAALLCFDATGEADLLELGRRHTLERMAHHVTHIGVHDHGFNNLSTYGNLRRLMREGRIDHDAWEMNFYEMAIKASASAQAARWSPTADGGGYIYSFNGPHSLFIDTMRTIRILGVGHQLGHALMGENDKRISLLSRLVAHAATSARYLVWYGTGRDAYDTAEERGRTAHEGVFNRNDGNYRCPNSQQGYSPFTTWTRGLAWAVTGYAEELEFLRSLDEEAFSNGDMPWGWDKERVIECFEKAALAVADHYIDRATAADGICYWDGGAPGLAKMGDWRSVPADPYNAHEPVDSSASAIAAQGLIRLGQYLGAERGRRYTQAGLQVAFRLLQEPYLSTDPEHQGLLLHSVYHRPNGWDHVPEGRSVPCDESSMWGDYHLLELGVLLSRMIRDEPYLKFFD